MIFGHLKPIWQPERDKNKRDNSDECDRWMRW